MATRKRRPWNADLRMPGLLGEPETELKPAPDTISQSHSTGVHFEVTDATPVEKRTSGKVAGLRFSLTENLRARGSARIHIEQMATAYRIHNADESLETLLDPTRPDGWMASDESLKSQPHGISCCASIDDLMAYARMYSMSALPGARLVELTGEWSYDQDRDQGARRMVVRSYRVIGHGDRLVRAAQRRR